MILPLADARWRQTMRYPGVLHGASLAGRGEDIQGFSYKTNIIKKFLFAGEWRRILSAIQSAKQFSF